MALFAEAGYAGCPACTMFESDDQWCTLSFVAAFPALDLFPSAAGWANRTVELRDCPECGRTVARVVVPRSRAPEPNREGSLKLYDFPSSPHCIKVRAVAYELGIRLNFATVDIFKREMDTPAFHTLNPNALVPVLVDGDFVLWESNAIITYLATTHPMPSLLSPNARERADVDRWLHWQSAHLGPAISRIAFERFVKPMAGQGATDAAAVASARHDFTGHCGALEASLADTEYVAKRLTVADFALACVLNTSVMTGVELRAFPRLSAWLRRMLARESLKRAFADAHQSLQGMYGSPANGEDGGVQ